MSILFSEDKRCGFFHKFDAKSELNKILNELESIGVKNFLSCKQIHSDKIFIDSSGDGDGIIITKKDSCAAVFTADCFSVAVYDEKLPIAGIFHSGWRGTVANITGKGCEILKNLGAQNLKAVIFPGIHSCCFEIGRELVNDFLNAKITVFERKNSVYADIFSAILNQLQEKGVKKIENLSSCTYCSGDYFSYRKTKTEKRHLSFVRN